jgi:hypothetical protein
MSQYDFLGYVPRLSPETQKVGRITIGSLVRITTPKPNTIPGGWGEGVDNSSVGVLTQYRHGDGVQIDFPNFEGFYTGYSHIEEVLLDNEWYLYRAKPLPEELRDLDLNVRTYVLP